ncbi:ABC transporter permease [bacterium]|nr:ABC transporter permease [bacterium]MBU1753078.1 ABC transporter permease [bacterium]
MLYYIIKRILLTIPVLLGIATITFILLFLVPGDATLCVVGERVDKVTMELIRKERGMDKPIMERYINYLSRLACLDLGRSYSTGARVSKAICERFPNTLRLAVAAMFVAIIIGIPLGILSAVMRGKFVDYICMFLAVFGVSTPVFWFGLLLICVFSIYLGWLPASGMGNGDIQHLVMPALTLGLHSVAFIARVTRSSMLEVMGEDYIRTARAKGVPEYIVILRHAMKNALIPVITLIGLDFGSYLNGSVLTETIFGWPGLGRYAVEGIMKRDIPIVMGTVLFSAAVFVMVNLVVDILYRFLNPRIRV